MCISLGGYSLDPHQQATQSRPTSTSACPKRSLRHADVGPWPEFEASDSQWSQSLIRLDLANSMEAAAKDSDPRRKPDSLVDQALNISADKPITSVLQRSRERSSERPASGAASASSTRSIKP